MGKDQNLFKAIAMSRGDLVYLIPAYDVCDPGRSPSRNSLCQNLWWYYQDYLKSKEFHVRQFGFEQPPFDLAKPRITQRYLDHCEELTRWVYDPNGNIDVSFASHLDL